MSSAPTATALFLGIAKIQKNGQSALRMSAGA